MPRSVRSIEGRSDALPAAVVAPAASRTAEVAPLQEQIRAHEQALAILKHRADDEFLVTVARTVGRHVFSAAELWSHAALAPELDAAIRAAGITSCCRLGKRLRRLRGRVVGGVSIERVGVERDGVVWSVREGVEDLRIPACSATAPRP
jgi:hypothetical protein